MKCTKIFVFFTININGNDLGEERERKRQSRFDSIQMKMLFWNIVQQLRTILGQIEDELLMLFKVILVQR